MNLPLPQDYPHRGVVCGRFGPSSSSANIDPQERNFPPATPGGGADPSPFLGGGGGSLVLTFVRAAILPPGEPQSLGASTPWASRRPLPLTWLLP